MLLLLRRMFQCVYRQAGDEALLQELVLNYVSGHDL